jgi:SAM-dependent methyltransferase
MGLRVVKTWPALDAGRSDFRWEFARLLRESPQLRGRVLDIGCGANLPIELRRMYDAFGPMDGVDPDPAIAEHPSLVHRWHGHFESCPVPGQTYDLAFAYNVLEHLAEPRPFFVKLASVLKPGGVFWAMAPNAHHPFALCSRAVDVLGLKPLARGWLGRRASFPMHVNEYASYYRANSPAAIRRAIAGLGFARASFDHVPCAQWDRYFPPALRWAPRTWDVLVSARVTSMSLILFVRLEKAGGPWKAG